MSSPSPPARSNKRVIENEKQSEKKRTRHLQPADVDESDIEVEPVRKKSRSAVVCESDDAEYSEEDDEPVEEEPVKQKKVTGRKAIESLRETSASSGTPAIAHKRTSEDLEMPQKKKYVSPLNLSSLSHGSQFHCDRTKKDTKKPALRNGWDNSNKKSVTNNEDKENDSVVNDYAGFVGNDETDEVEKSSVSKKGLKRVGDDKVQSTVNSSDRI